MTKQVYMHGPADQDRHYHMVRCPRCNYVATLTVDYYGVSGGYEVECHNPECRDKPTSPGLLRGVMIGLAVAITGWCGIVIVLARLIATIWR